MVVFAAFGVTPSSPATADDHENGSFVGSWIGTIDPGTPGAFLDLLSINLGGTATGTNGNAHNQDPSLPPAARLEASDFFGSWEPIGHNQLAATVKWLLFLGPTGQNIGVVSLDTFATLQHDTKSGDSLIGDYTLQVTDLNGHQVRTSSGTLFFRRIEPPARP